MNRLKKTLNKISKWISNHRYFLLMDPKGWDAEKEAYYQKWALTQAPIPGACSSWRNRPTVEAK